MSSSDWYIRCLKIFGGESRYSFNTNVSEYVDGVFARYDLDDSGKISFEGNDQAFLICLSIITLIMKPTSVDCNLHPNGCIF